MGWSYFIVSANFILLDYSLNFSELKGSSKYFFNYLIIIFAGIKTLITFAPAFIAKFIQDL
jgi:hypothetical protein